MLDPIEMYAVFNASSLNAGPDFGRFVMAIDEGLSSCRADPWSSSPDPVLMVRRSKHAGTDARRLDMLRGVLPVCIDEHIPRRRTRSELGLHLNMLMYCLM